MTAPDPVPMFVRGDRVADRSSGASGWVVKVFGLGYVGVEWELATWAGIQVVPVRSLRRPSVPPYR